jgi:hypothetical protein
MPANNSYCPAFGRHAAAVVKLFIIFFLIRSLFYSFQIQQTLSFLPLLRLMHAPYKCDPLSIGGPSFLNLGDYPLARGAAHSAPIISQQPTSDHAPFFPFIPSFFPCQSLVPSIDLS